MPKFFQKLSKKKINNKEEKDMSNKKTVIVLLGGMIIFGSLMLFSPIEKTPVSLAKVQEECEACPGEGVEDNPCTENSFTGWIKLYPDKTVLVPGESFNLKIDWYRTCWCPSDYFKVFIKNETTGEITEIGRHAEPYWTMCSSYCAESYTQASTAPTEPGNYTVKVVHATGHGQEWCGYYSVNWNCPRSDGGFVGHKPEELSWDFYEISAEFKITVGRIFPEKAVELAKEVIGAPYLGDGRTWGGKGLQCNWGRFKFVDSQEITTIGYYFYDGRIPGCSKEKGIGLDCSGLSFWSYNRAYFGGKILTLEEFKKRPLLYDGAANQYLFNTDRIKKEDLRPGDLIFFDTDKNNRMDHVAMYVGEGEVIHAEGVLFKKIVKEKLETILSRYKEYFKDYFGRVVEPKKEGEIKAKSPIDLIVQDPEGWVITPENRWDVPGMEYQNYDIDGDGKIDDIVVLGERKIGDYLIQVVPEPDALSVNTYTLEVELLVNGEFVTVVLAENVPISDIPRRPYILRSTETEIIPIIPAFVDFDPDNLNLKSKGRWVTVYLELPIGYNVNEINLGSIRLNGQIQAEPKPTEIGDYDDNGIPDLMVKFNRLAVQNILETGDEARITISGKLNDGRPFEGSDIIKVIKDNSIKQENKGRNTKNT